MFGNLTLTQGLYGSFIFAKTHTCEISRGDDFLSKSAKMMTKVDLIDQGEKLIGKVDLIERKETC